MKLIAKLKEEGQDFEFYPTTPAMIHAIYKYHPTRDKCYPWHDEYHFGSVLDIGCGTCNFKTYIDELNKQAKENEDVKIRGYYVIEKSKILLERLPASCVVLGCDFRENTLIDKPVDTIFCNPPYSEYEDWAAKIITESVCRDIYLIIPQRWKDSEKIKAALGRVQGRFTRRSDDYEPAVTVVGSFDFLDAERSARAKVDIIHIDKSTTRKDDGFSQFFDETFPMGGSDGKYDFKSEEYRESVKHELLAGRNKIEILCNGYIEAQRVLFEHFRAICSLDADILKSINVSKADVMSALKQKVEGLKSMYWRLAFECLDEITSRLTTTSRDKMLTQFDKLLKVDFNPSNLYALVIWVIKNANGYYKSQMVDFFMRLTSPENIRNYKSNQRLFVRDKWGYCNREHSHYTLDYRIVCSAYSLPGKGTDYSFERDSIAREISVKIADVITVARNLNFDIGETIYPEAYGKKGYVMKPDGAPLFEFKLYMNGNVHLKFDKEFMKALNVEVSRELGWIHGVEDIAREFTPDMAQGAEKYFDKTLRIGMTAAPALMLNGAA